MQLVMIFMLLVNAHHELSVQTDSLNMSMVATFHALGFVNDMQVVGDYAFLAEGSSFTILNIADPTRIYEVGRTSFDSEVRALEILDTFAYVLGESGLTILSIADLENIYTVGTSSLPRWATDIYVQGTTVFAAEGDMGLYIVDVSDPANPTEIAHIPAYLWFNSVYVSGDYAYIGDDSGLVVVNISDPSSPSVESFLPTEGYVNDVVVVDTVAYVAGGASGFLVFSVADPSNPYEIARCTVPTNAKRLYLSNDYAFVIDFSVHEVETLRVIDITDPANPTPIGAVSICPYPLSLYVSENYAFVGCGGSVQAIDVSDPAAPQHVGMYLIPSPPNFAVIEDHLYFVDSYTFGVLDISDMHRAFLLSATDLNAEAAKLIVSGNYAYCAEPDFGIEIFDVSDPQNPSKVGEYPHENCLEIFVHDSLLLMTDQTSFHVIDISVPSTPTEVSSIDLGLFYSSFRIWAYGNYAFVGWRMQSLFVIDLSDPQSPQIVDTLWIEDYIQSITGFGDLLFVGGFYIHIIEVSNPLSPTQIAAIPSNGFRVSSLYTDGSNLFAICWPEGINIYDITDPLNPTEIAHYEENFTWFFTGDLSVTNGYLFATYEYNGIKVFSLPMPEIIRPAQNAQIYHPGEVEIIWKSPTYQDDIVGYNLVIDSLLEYPTQDTSLSVELDYGVHFCQVAAVRANGAVFWSGIHFFRICDSLGPNPPILEYPINGVWVSTDTIEFQWSEVENATYAFQLLADFDSVIFEDTIDFNELQLSGLNEGLYLWRVEAFYEPNGYRSGWTLPERFGLDRTPPSIDSMTILTDTAGFYGPFTVEVWASDTLSGIADAWLFTAIDTTVFDSNEMHFENGVWQRHIRHVQPHRDHTISYFVKLLDNSTPSNITVSDTVTFQIIGIDEEDRQPETGMPMFRIVGDMILLQVPQNRNVEVKIYDVNGRLVWRKRVGAGVHNVRPQLPHDGIFFVRINGVTQKLSKF